MHVLKAAGFPLLFPRGISLRIINYGYQTLYFHFNLIENAIILESRQFTTAKRAS